MKRIIKKLGKRKTKVGKLEQGMKVVPAAEWTKQGGGCLPTSVPMTVITQ